MNEILQVNRILIPSNIINYFAKVENMGMLPDRRRVMSDPESIRFLFEVLVSHGAYNIALTESIPKDILPYGFNKLIVSIDNLDRVHRQVRSFLSPFGEEFSINTDNWRSTSDLRNIFVEMMMRTPYNNVIPIYKSLYYIAETLYSILIGITNKLCISINLQKAKESIFLLFDVAKNPVATQNLSFLTGILNSYSEITIETINVFTSNANTEALNRFLIFTEDESFNHMSKQISSLGLHTNKDNAIIKIKRYANELSQKTIFKPIVSLASTVISASTGIPIPCTEISEL
jgi:hypothetical protein